MDIRKKTVLVTGSSSGIGRETAIQFSKKGSNVVVTYNKGKKNGENVLRECKKNGDAILVNLDLAKDASIKNAFRKAVKKFGKVDILVNNAGIFASKKLEKQKKEEIENQVNVNITGLIKITREFLARKNKGIIINIASGAGKTAYPGMSVYCATKFAVRGFTQSIAQETGVKVYCINPGLTATRMTGYRGDRPSEVAEIIVKAAEERLGKKSGDDIDIWDYI